MRARACATMYMHYFASVKIVRVRHGCAFVMLGARLRVLRPCTLTETTKNRDVCSGPFDRPFARSLTLLIHSLAPRCSLFLRALLRLFVCSLARLLTHS